MREIYIKYNPYKLETEILVDGKAPKQNSELNVGERRLQEWIEKLPEILWTEYSCADFKLIFYGTTLDYEDVVSMANNAKNAKERKVTFKLEHRPAKEVADKEVLIDQIFDEILIGPFDELKGTDIKHAFEMAKGKDFEVDIVATMSAGKSTLINALLGQKLMPAKHEACTATITRIKDNDSDYFMARAYNADNRVIQVCPKLSYEDMSKLNDDGQVVKIEAEGNIPFVTADDVSLVLVDTPGPNNARDPRHRETTYKMLSDSAKPLILYILDATKLGVDDDANLLEYVSKNMQVDGKQSRDRFIFVVNKLDDFKKDEDRVKESIENVRNYLRGYDIEDANIYPVSALTALNIRTILAESDDDDDDDVYDAKGKVRKFNRNEEMHFEKLAPLTPSVRKKIEERLENAVQKEDKNEQALIHCGIVPIEMAIQTYVQKYAKTAKIKNIVDTFSRRVESAKAFENTKNEIVKNQSEHEQILKNIARINAKVKSGENAKKFKARIEKINYKDEIKNVADAIILKCQNKITDKILGKKDVHMSKGEATEYVKQLAHFSDNLLAEIKVELEKTVENHVHKNAQALLEEYKIKIKELTKDLNIGTVSINPFEIMQGNIEGLSNIEILLEEAEQKEKKWEVVGNHREYKELFGFRRWLNNHFGTSFEVDYDVIDDYDWVEHSYINATSLSQKFLAPVQVQLYKNGNEAVEYAKEQARNIKAEFKKKFDELDALLIKKMKELESCVKDSRTIEDRIKDSQKKLEWLDEIQKKINSILDI